MKIFLAFLFAFLLFRCKNDASKSDSEGKVLIESSSGLISFKGDTKDAIDFYDEKGKKIAIFYLYDLTNLKRVTPYAYNAEFRLLAFKTVPSELPDMYKVRSAINDDIIYVKKNDGLFVSKTWQEHVLSVYAVRSTQESHFYEKASAHSNEVILKPEEVATPVKIEGDWLQVEYEQEGANHKAWIRWTKNGRIIVGLVYVT